MTLPVSQPTGTALAEIGRVLHQAAALIEDIVALVGSAHDSLA
jgi:hypothetical protein